MYTLGKDYFLQILDKKVKKNPKYENVKSVISTGKTMKDVEIMSKENEAHDIIQATNLQQRGKERDSRESRDQPSLNYFKRATMMSLFTILLRHKWLGFRLVTR